MHTNDTSTSGGRRNALAAETSPYLLQHAANPVDWHPWGEAALALARSTGKPILLSIGYSACHWCHVMAHESFEDEETAALMNALFVNIKVDREERPDLDRIYQTAQQLLNRRNGGWPLTMFLTHDDHVPFAGGTYFPKEARWGMPDFRSVLRHVAEVYRERLADIRTQNAAVLEALAQMQPPSPAAKVELGAAPLLAARAQLGRMYDPRFGGFGEAPKFPHAPMIERLMRHHAASERAGDPDEAALEMATHTLRCMAEGGIYDHLGGGFARYSTDAQWQIPHFEKMLYDNGPLLALYAEAWQLTGDEQFARVATETGEWIIREMQSPEGGYYCSLDADSDGHEGRFYVWQRSEVQELLDADEYRCFAPRYGLDQPANFEGAWHLHIATDIEAIAAAEEIATAEVVTRLDHARRKLLDARGRRTWPARDEKVLCSWNALAIRGLAIAGRILQRASFVDSAARALDFLRRELWRDGRLLATSKDGRAHLRAYLDDYAFLLEAVLELLQASWRVGDLDFALALAERLLADFEDDRDGGFFFTAHDHEPLIQRIRGFADDALPAGNGVAASTLARLGHMLGSERLLHAAERTLAAGWEAARQHPTAHLTLLRAIDEALQPPEVLVIRGQDPELVGQWAREAQCRYAPTRMVLTPDPLERRLIGSVGEAGDLPAVGFRCQGSVCSPPILDPARLR